MIRVSFVRASSTIRVCPLRLRSELGKLPVDREDFLGRGGVEFNFHGRGHLIAI